ncbi:hypothetical protein [Qiania dongpingensis]|uniref:Uncharacterized protein n=1 Tax=Qiania dongpingensis TaxID=2763669 RepID=A0A7G9G3S4_9FIRM|nr:hypothetical protein [Qiania dongpingensis]QNM05456.1 hypothetical protein H9Q78_13655 [Qiania dongpingensis]
MKVNHRYTFVVIAIAITAIIVIWAIKFLLPAKRPVFELKYSTSYDDVLKKFEAKFDENILNDIIEVPIHII